jgi:hypothetical protein
MATGPLWADPWVGPWACGCDKGVEEGVEGTIEELPGMPDGGWTAADAADIAGNARKNAANRVPSNVA